MSGKPTKRGRARGRGSSKARAGSADEDSEKQAGQAAAGTEFGSELLRNDYEESVSSEASSDGDEGGVEATDAAREETADAKRLRMAREYLARLTSSAGAGSAADDVAGALQADVDRKRAAVGRAKVTLVASLLVRADLGAATRRLHAHKLPATCVAVDASGQTAYTGSKDCSIVAWELSSGARRVWPGRRRTRADLRAAAEQRAARKAAGTRTADAGKAWSGGGALEALARDGMGVAAGASAGAVALRTGESGAGYGIQGHWDQVLSVALSPDGRTLVSGGRDWLVRCWRAGDAASAAAMPPKGASAAAPPSSDKSSLRPVRMLRGHAGAVTGLAFDAAGSGRVYSCSEDRSLRGWDPSTGAFVEALYGHSSAPTAVAPLRPGRLVSTGGQERAARAWKLEAETQLVFRGPGTTLTLDCVAGVLGGRMFVTGGQDGSLHLWSAERKKPISTVKAAHEGPLVSIASLVGTDLIATGSSDGFIRFWRVVQPGAARQAQADADDDDDASDDDAGDDAGAEAGSDAAAAGYDASEGGSGAASASVSVSPPLRESGLFREVARVSVDGFVNGLAFANEGTRLVAAVGSEHRMGRWWRMKNVKAGIVVVDLPAAVATALAPSV